MHGVAAGRRGWVGGEGVVMCVLYQLIHYYFVAVACESETRLEWNNRKVTGVARWGSARMVAMVIGQLIAISPGERV